MELIAVANKNSIPPQPRKHPRPPSPSVRRPTAHLAYHPPYPTNIHVHTKEVERKETSRKESRTLSDICNRKYKNKRKVWNRDKGNVCLINDAYQRKLRKRKYEPARRSGARDQSSTRRQVGNGGWRGHQRGVPSGRATLH